MTVDLHCPHCNGLLVSGTDTFTCGNCAANFPAIQGIPDLRRSDPPYASRSEDFARARTVAERFEALSFKELLTFTYGTLHSEISEVDHFVQRRIERIKLNALRRRRCRNLLAHLQITVPQGVALDLGCGVGGFVPMLAADFDHVIGIDVAMEELVLAQKYLCEQGINNVTLVCTEGEAIPCAPETIAYVNATSVIEHVADPHQVVAGIRRILVDGGVFAFDSPNRFDLVYPEPHVDVRFVGLWPRPLQELYVRLVSGKEYKGKRLLSLTDIGRILHKNAPTDHRHIFYWPRWQQRNIERSRSRFLFKRLPALIPWLNRRWAHFVGVHEVILQKQAQHGEQTILPLPLQVDTGAL